jgi:subtilisin-like proprotein convertase family protein
MKKYSIIFVFVFALLFTVGKITTAQVEKEEKASVAEVSDQPLLSARKARFDINAKDLPSSNALQTNEIEPNETAAAATLISGRTAKVRADVYPNADVDYFSFYATAGDKVYIATMTANTATGTSTNSIIDLFSTDGTTIIETDDDDGSLAATASSIAGATVTVTGLQFIRVRNPSLTSQIRPYDLYLNIQSGSPTNEVEPNETLGTATPIPANGFVRGTHNPTADLDLFSFNANAGDTVYLSLDLDPERDSTTWNGQLGLGVFNGFILSVNDAGASTPSSEAFFMKIKNSGTYYASVAAPAGVIGAATNTYNLSVVIIPAKESKCTTYTSVAAAQPIGPDPTNPNAVQTITIPDSKIIANLKVGIKLNHAKLADVDLHITTPQGNDITLFNDVGPTGLATMDVVIDDDAAFPINTFTTQSDVTYQPENFSRLAWTKGENVQGTWTLTARDDTVGDAGTLTSWSVIACEEPSLPSPNETVIYQSDFEANDGGFTHSGTADEWQRGLPTAAPITTCASGVNCWKTDLAATPDVSSIQDLVSPNINLTAQTGKAIKLNWSHKYGMESASFENYFVEVREVGGAGMSKIVFRHLDGSMQGFVGSPSVTLQATAGWGKQEVDISQFAGKNIEVRFHVDTDTSVQYPGVGVDDVKISVSGSIPNADFDGNGSTDVSVFRNNGEDGTDGRWYILTNLATGAFTQQLFGFDSDIQVPGDYDGDGDVDIAVFRESEGGWYISKGSRFNFDFVKFGIAGDKPVHADYDGDGKTDIAVFRSSNAFWYIRRSSDGGITYFAFGGGLDKPVPRDYDGDGKADIAVFRFGTWYIFQSFYQTVKTVNWGDPSDSPVPADYDGDRKTDIAVYRPAEGNWYVKNSANCIDTVTRFGGLPNDLPVQGDYDRDRKADFAIFRGTSGTWYVRKSSDNSFFGVNWGIAVDTPIPPR